MNRLPLITVCQVALVLLATRGGLAEEPRHADPAVQPASYLLHAAYTTPAVHDGCAQYAQFEPTPDLRRLGPCCGACEVGWFHGRLWYEAQYLGWVTKGAPYPALLTTGDPATPAADAGALDQADTQTLFGQRTLFDDWRSGGRFTLGFWHTPEQQLGLETNIFGIDGRDAVARPASNRLDVIARPYTDAVTGTEQSLLIAYPGLLSGGSLLRADMELVGAEALLRQAILWREKGRVDVLAGYRHGYLRDSLGILDNSVSLSALTGYPVDTLIQRRDVLAVRNYFHGGEIGFDTRLWRGCWSLNLTTKAAFGSTRTRSLVAGATETTEDPLGMPIFIHGDGALLALPTNITRRETVRRSFQTEIGVELEYQLSTRSRIGLGYTFFYWDNVARLGPSIDTTINPTQIPPGVLVGAARPEFNLAVTDFWAQGLNATFEHQF